MLLLPLFLQFPKLLEADGALTFWGTGKKRILDRFLGTTGFFLSELPQIL